MTNRPASCDGIGVILMALIAGQAEPYSRLMHLVLIRCST